MSDRLDASRFWCRGLALAAVLPFFVIPAGDSFIMVPLVMAGLGLFSFALHQVMLAAILDGAVRGTEATVAGLVFGINGAVGFASTALAATIIENFGGYGSVYIYVGTLTVLAGIIVILTPFPKYEPQIA